jgi:solute carrier family 35 (UDP-sugar transporter), member A1/2/3
MHYSRIMPPVNGHRYFASTAVLLNEVLKLIVSTAIAYRDTAANMGGSASADTVMRTLYKEVFAGDSWKLAIPAALYTFQNTLQYMAVSNLDAATFQVMYQLKILATAVFTVTLLKRNLSVKKWVSLLLLMAGVAAVSILPDGSETGSNSNPKGLEAHARSNMSRTIGMVSVIIACATSGLAGVYFEKVLKDSTKVTLWVRNIQLSFYSLFPALFIGVMLKDGREISKIGFFAGYNHVVVAAIASQSMGGLIVALVVRYADNIAKNFATSISIILSFVASVFLFDFKFSFNVSEFRGLRNAVLTIVQFVVGMAIVLYATWLYGNADRRAVASKETEYRQPINDDEAKIGSDSQEKPILPR